MDILKVLSRGTKGRSGASRGIALRTSADLPSAGAHIHPQLFNDPVGSASNSNSRKRKRGGGSKATEGNGGKNGEESTDDENDSVSDVSELDFFAARDSAKTDEAASAKKTKSNSDKKSSNKTKKEKTATKPTDRTSELLDEEECRQIFRSHRLKLSLLSDKAEKAEKVEKEQSKKKTKKSKKEAAEEAKAAKDDKKPLLPQPLTAFSQLRHTYGISPRLADNLDRLLYRIPTEVQMGSLPLLLDPALALSKAEMPGDGGKRLREELSADGGGVDFMAVAPTGSGKTLSFLVPSINSVLKRRADEKAGLDDAEATAGNGSKRRNDHGLHTVVVAPTRELARQIANEGKKLAVGTGVRVVAMRKGMRVQAASADDGENGDEKASNGIDDDGSSAGSDSDNDDDDDDDEEEEEEEEKQGAKGGKSTKTKKTAAVATVTKADILVTTPLMLLNSLSEGSAKRKSTLPTVRTLVLDEADVLLDPLFREQTLGLWAACTHPRLQATFWSATMASNAEELVASQLAAAGKKKKEKADSTSGGSSGSGSCSGNGRPLVRLVVGLKDTAVPNVTHRLVYTATEQGKLLAMRQLLHPTTSVSVTSTGAAAAAAAETPLRPPFLVFAQTAERATALHDELKYDIPAAAGGADRLGVLHAALSDGARAAVVRKFRAGEVWVLITTDVLARGIDFAGVNGVVNYDVPGSAAAYVHRAGRTGRAGRQGGLAVTLYTKEDIPFVKTVANVIAASEKQAAQGKRSSTTASAEAEAAAAAAGTPAAVPQWLLDALPNVTKADKKRLKTRGMESRRTAGSGSGNGNGNGNSNGNGNGSGNGKSKGKDSSSGAGRSRITSKSAWERRKENNLRDAIASSKRRKLEAEKNGRDNDEWAGLD